MLNLNPKVKAKISDSPADKSGWRAQFEMRIVGCWIQWIFFPYVQRIYSDPKQGLETSGSYCRHFTSFKGNAHDVMLQNAFTSFLCILRLYSEQADIEAWGFEKRIHTSIIYVYSAVQFFSVAQCLTQSNVGLLLEFDKSSSALPKKPPVCLTEDISPEIGDWKTRVVAFFWNFSSSRHATTKKGLRGISKSFPWDFPEDSGVRFDFKGKFTAFFALGRKTRHMLSFFVTHP